MTAGNTSAFAGCGQVQTSKALSRINKVLFVFIFSITKTRRLVRNRKCFVVKLHNDFGFFWQLASFPQDYLITMRSFNRITLILNYL